MPEEPYDPVARKAAFAQEFKGTTNLDQRRRYAQDITEARDRDKERRQQEFEQLQIQRPEVGRLMLGRETEDRRAAEGRVTQGLAIQKQGLAERKQQFQESKDISMEDIARRRLSFQEESSKRAMRKELLDTDRMEAEQEAELIVQAREHDLRRDPKTPPGSSAYKRAVLDLLIKNPDISKDTRNVWLKQAGYEDPDLAVKEAADQMASNPLIQKQTVTTDRGTTTMVSPKPTQGADALEKELTGLYKDLRLARKDVDSMDEVETSRLEKLISAKEAKLNQMEKEAGATPTATEPTPSASSEGVQRKAKDGSIWLFNPETKQAIRKLE